MVELLASMVTGCSGTVLFFGFIFIALRFSILVAVVVLFFQVFHEVQRHRSGTSTLETSLLPMVESDTDTKSKKLPLKPAKNRDPGGKVGDSRTSLSKIHA